MALSAAEKATIISEYQLATNDTGSVEVQTAILTVDIKKLTEHMKEHSHDFHSRRGLIKKVHQRRKLLDYLKKKDNPRYRTLVGKLGLKVSK